MAKRLSDTQVLARWRYDPVAFVREAFGVEPDLWQADVLRAFPAEQCIAMKAAKGPGKTTVEVWMALNFLVTRPYPKILVTSITGDNLDDNIWPEFAKWMHRCKWISDRYEWKKTRIVSRENPAEWFISARTWSKNADKSEQAQTLAGAHADYMMFVLDESGGIPDSVAVAAEAGLSTGIECKIVQAGNPTHLEGPLWRACNQDRAKWFIVEITGDPDDLKRSPRISVEWAKSQIEKYGKDNPWVLVNVFGKFPPASLNSLVGIDEVLLAMKRHMPEENFRWSQKRLGVDVARFGDDRTVIFARQGLRALPPVELRGQRTTDIAARVIKEKLEWGSEMEFVDDTGHWGHGVIDNMLAAGYSPLGIQFHGQAIDPRYRNRRAEMWVGMTEWIKRGGSLPNIPELVGELTTPTYTFVNGKFQLEDKDQIKTRLGRSPDLADALALTFCLPDAPTQIDDIRSRIIREQQGPMAHEWDPFDESRL